MHLANPCCFQLTILPLGAVATKMVRSAYVYMIFEIERTMEWSVPRWPGSPESAVAIRFGPEAGNWLV